MSAYVTVGKSSPSSRGSWDDSSSVSSGLSDTLDNISTDDLTTPAYSAVGSSRKSKGAQVRGHDICDALAANLMTAAG